MKKLNGEKILSKLGLSTRRSKQFGKNLEEIIEQELKEVKEETEIKKKTKKINILEIKNTYRDEEGDK